MDLERSYPRVWTSATTNYDVTFAEPGCRARSLDKETGEIIIAPGTRVHEEDWNRHVEEGTTQNKWTPKEPKSSATQSNKDRILLLRSIARDLKQENLALKNFLESKGLLEEFTNNNASS